MGEIADYYMDLAMQQDAEYEALKHRLDGMATQVLEDYQMGVAEWTTKDNEMIPVIKMTKDHVQNCLKMMMKNNVKFKNPYRTAWIKIFKAEIKKRNY
jgi:hypothetical protein